MLAGQHAAAAYNCYINDVLWTIVHCEAGTANLAFLPLCNSCLPQLPGGTCKIMTCAGGTPGTSTVTP